jgi:hypothetical protein
MSSSDIIIDKVLADAGFCAQLVASPAETLGALGVTPTPDVVAALKGLDPQSLQRLASAFGKQQAAF